MKWMDKLNENIKKGIRSWLNILPANPNKTHCRNLGWNPPDGKDESSNKLLSFEVINLNGVGSQSREIHSQNRRDKGNPNRIYQSSTGRNVVIRH